MSDKTPDNKKTAGARRSTNSSAPSGDDSPSPLGNNSFSLAPGDSRTSNTRFGAIGGPTTPVGTRPESGFVLPAPHSQLGPAIRHVQSLASLTPSSSTERTLRSNQPGNSYVTNLTTWRRGPDQTAPPPATPRAEVRGQGRPETRREAPAARQIDALTTAYQGMEIQKYQGGKQQQQQQQQQSKKGGQQQLALYRPREPFKPMNVKLDPEAANRPLTEEDKAYRDAKGISHNYKGDARNPTNESADIPDAMNCAVWVTRLPPDCTYIDLLSAVAVHRPGKVFATVISPPKEPENERQARLPSACHSAAKIVFYYAHSAHHLIRVSNQMRFTVKGYPARVIPNKIKSAPQLYPNPTTRCVEIRGPANIVGELQLAPLFNQYFWWETEEVLVRREWTESGVRMRIIEWRFASHHAQAGSAFSTIRDHCLSASAFYVPDPCEPQGPALQILGQQGQQWQ